MEKLIKLLSDYGTVEICKAGEVFTLLITGKGLNNALTVSEIQLLYLGALKGKYPFIEAVRNTDNYYCVVLKN